MQAITIGITARLAALRRMIELFPDHATITVIDGSHRAVGTVIVSAVEPLPPDASLVVGDVMVALAS